MSVWTVPIGITEVTQQYVRDNMPAGTTKVVIPALAAQAYSRS